MTTRRQFGGECRALPGSVIEGTALSYADTTMLPDGRRERFVPGAFGDVGDVPLNLQHDPAIQLGSATLTDSSDALSARAVVPSGIHALVKRRTLSGFSIEFHAREERADGDSRIIERADLVGLSVVDRGAYGDSRIEARGQWKKAAMQPGARKRRPYVRSSIKTGRTSHCECLPGQGLTHVHFRAGAFDRVVEEAEAGTHTVIAIIGNRGPHNMLASTVSNTLILSILTGGSLGLEIDDAAANTPAGRSLADSDAVQPVVVRPLIDQEESEFVDEGDTRIYTSAFFRTLLFKAAPDRFGWEPLLWWIPDDEDEPAAGPVQLPWWADPASLL